MASHLGIEDSLLSLLVAHFNLHWDDEHFCYAYDNGELFTPDDYEWLEIPITTIEWENKIDPTAKGELSRCDGILFFGDGCIEFHDIDSCEAFNWSCFKDRSIFAITEVVINKVG